MEMIPDPKPLRRRVLTALLEDLLRVCTAGADSLTRLLCLPVRVSGYPLVLRLEACHDRKAWQIVSLPQGERM